jgi:membrane-bound ClpP family serine protease
LELALHSDPPTGQSFSNSSVPFWTPGTGHSTLHACWRHSFIHTFQQPIVSRLFLILFCLLFVVCLFFEFLPSVSCEF